MTTPSSPNDNTTHKHTRPVAGVWQRLWEEDPLGDADGADRTTLVLWTQAPESGIYVDLRLPMESPGRSPDDAKNAGFTPRPSAIEATGMNFESGKVTSNLVSVLYQQKSFAGVLDYTPGDTTSGEALSKDIVLAELASKAKDGTLSLCTCFWRRDIDYQPPSGGLDIGVCASEAPNPDGSIDLRETGDDASYAEGWHRLPGTNKGPFLALRLESEDGKSRSGFWVRTGSHFAYAVGRPDDRDPTLAHLLGCHDKSSQVKNLVGKSLQEAMDDSIQVATIDDKLSIVGSYLVVAGKIESNGDWKILHSTSPELVGCCLLSATNSMDTPLCCSSTKQCSTSDSNKELKVGDFIEQTLAGSKEAVRKWKVEEISGGDAFL